MSNSWKAICRDPNTNLNSYKTWMVSNKNLPKKIQWLRFHFSYTFKTNNVKVIKNGVWMDQAQQDWSYSLIMYALTDIAQKVCKKK